MTARILHRGKIIVFEGMDRCGKTTQAKKLAELLKRTNSNGAKFIHFPDRSTPIGGMINKYLRKEIELDDHAVHLLFTANRWELMNEIEKDVNNGVDIIIDRYSYSGVAYSAAKPSLSIEWSYDMEKGLIAPDAVFFLSVPMENSMLRGDFGLERYETPEFQEKVDKNYKLLWDDKIWYDINAVGSPEEIHRHIYSIFKSIVVEERIRRI